MRYEFVAAQAGEHAITRMCQVLDVGRSGYYAWRNREPSGREKSNQELVEQIQAVHQNSRQLYGSPRIHAALRSKGVVCGKNRVARLMQLHRIVGKKPKRRFPVTTRRRPGALAAPNLLNQDFTASAPNMKWVTDITYIDTREGWLYLAPVLDLHSRMIVGWAMADHMETSLVEDAFRMALARRRPPSGLLHHSDQGSQYTSHAYQEQMKARHIQVSMSRVGNCYDNAVMESFFGTLKTECAGGQFRTHAQARRNIFEYIEVWYNRQRLHSSLGYLSPAEFERIHGH
jgi:putative transposase